VQTVLLVLTSIGRHDLMRCTVVASPDHNKSEAAMAGDAQVRSCSTMSAEPCVARPTAQDTAGNESGCTPKPAAAPKGLGQAGEIELVAGDMAHDFNNLLAIITTYTMLVLEDLEPDNPSRADLEQVCQAAERARELTRDLRALGQPSSSVVLST
jgi:hypothetical protein